MTPEQQHGAHANFCQYQRSQTSCIPLSSGLAVILRDLASRSDARLYVRGREFSTGIHRGNRLRCFNDTECTDYAATYYEDYCDKHFERGARMRCDGTVYGKNTLPVLNVTEVIVVRNSEFQKNPEYRSE
jgi:hypothetical protein